MYTFFVYYIHRQTTQAGYFHSSASTHRKHRYIVNKTGRRHSGRQQANQPNFHCAHFFSCTYVYIHVICYNCCYCNCIFIALPQFGNSLHKFLAKHKRLFWFLLLLFLFLFCKFIIICISLPALWAAAWLLAVGCCLYCHFAAVTETSWHAPVNHSVAIGSMAEVWKICMRCCTRMDFVFAIFPLYLVVLSMN